MATIGLDLAPLGQAFNEIAQPGRDRFSWQHHSLAQYQLFAWYIAQCEHIEALGDLGSFTSMDYRTLNAFLAERGIAPQFESFDGIGIASVFDLLLDWEVSGELATVHRYDISNRQQPHADYPAFRIPANGVEIFQVGQRNHPLVRIHTADGYSFWLYKAIEPVSGLRLPFTAQRLLLDERTPHRRWTAGTVVPMLGIDVQPDLTWVRRMEYGIPGEGFRQIAHVFQHIRLQANELSTRIQATTQHNDDGPKPYVFNEPFVCFLTAPSCDVVPLAVCWVDVDSWKSALGTPESA